MDRDCKERGRTVAQVVDQYHETVRPMHLQYVEPSKLVADLIVHSGFENPSSLDTACTVLKNHLKVTAGIAEPTPVTNMEEALANIKASMS